MRKPIAVCFSDLHLHEFKAFNDMDKSRLAWSLEVLVHIGKVAYKLKVPVLFNGDLVHNPMGATSAVINSMIATYRFAFERKQVRFIGISGNHDFSKQNFLDGTKPPSWMDTLQTFGTFENIDYRHTANRDFVVYGIPYLNRKDDLIHALGLAEQNMPKKVDRLKILLLHSDMPGAQTPEGYEVGESSLPTNLDKVFKNWDIVLCGHIHKPQKLSNKVYMLGSPIHQTTGDIGTDMGYWIMYNDKSMEFVSLANQFPVFTRDDSKKRDIDYYVAPEQESEIQETEQGEFDISNNRSTLAKKYLKVKGIKSKKKRKALTTVLNYADNG